MKRNNRLKFLSESILLEETGLPLMNTVIILCVALFIAVFILWSNEVTMEDSVDISGVVTVSSEGDGVSRIIGYASTKNINLVRLDAKVYIDIPGVTGRKSLNGSVASIKTEPVYDNNNAAYYEVMVELAVSESESNELNGPLLNGMESQLKIVTGTRTLMQYFLGSLYDTGLDVFDN